MTNTTHPTPVVLGYPELGKYVRAIIEAGRHASTEQREALVIVYRATQESSQLNRARGLAVEALCRVGKGWLMDTLYAETAEQFGITRRGGVPVEVREAVEDAALLFLAAFHAETRDWWDQEAVRPLGRPFLDTFGSLWHPRILPEGVPVPRSTWA